MISPLRTSPPPDARAIPVGQDVPAISLEPFFSGGRLNLGRGASNGIAPRFRVIVGSLHSSPDPTLPPEATFFFSFLLYGGIAGQQVLIRHTVGNGRLRRAARDRGRPLTCPLPQRPIGRGRRSVTAAPDQMWDSPSPSLGLRRAFFTLGPFFQFRARQPRSACPDFIPLQIDPQPVTDIRGHSSSPKGPTPHEPVLYESSSPRLPRPAPPSI